MAYRTFDLTENTQFSIRLGTGCHPDGPSLGVFLGAEDMFAHDADPDYRPKAFECYAYDAVEWGRAVELARWILKANDELFPDKE